MRVLSSPLAFVDIETTGGSYTHGRVLEVGVIRVENNRVVDQFSTLLNPIGTVPEFITGLTGITHDDVQSQPQFEEIFASGSYRTLTMTSKKPVNFRLAKACGVSQRSRRPVSSGHYCLSRAW